MAPDCLIFQHSRTPLRVGSALPLPPDSWQGSCTILRQIGRSRGRSEPLETHPGIVAKALTKQQKKSQTAEAELAFPIQAEPRPFDGYALGDPYDEMFGRDAVQRPQYQILHERLQ